MPALMLFALAAATMPAVPGVRDMSAGPAPPAFRPFQVDIAPGVKEIIAGRAAALVYVPSGYRGDAPLPMLVMLHGAGGTARGAIDLMKPHADALGILLLAPKSTASTWDIIADGRFGPDENGLDALVRKASIDYAVDQRRIAIGGFSDGASYALTIGLARGDFYSDIIAFSPGFAAPDRLAGMPNLFISHGLQDRVLSIETCSRPIARRLQRSGYTVRYEEFSGGHRVPDGLAREALQAFVRRPQAAQKIAA